MNNLGQATEAMARVATQTANQQAQLTAALQRLVEEPRQGTRAPAATPGPASVPFDTGGKILKPPEAFSPAAIEEVSQWSDWAFTFNIFLAFMDQAFLTDLKSAEDQKVEISSDISNTVFGDDRERMNRGLKLYSVLSSYLKNRLLKVLRSVSGMNGFEVWSKLTAELEPSSRSRSLAMAQALVGFPAMSKGASLMDYVLTFEKLISEYEKISGTKYDDNLKIGTLLKGIPQNLKQHVMVDITDRTTYDELRTKLLQYERSNQTWSAENILGSLSVPDPTTHTHTSSKPYQGPIPMELYRIYFRKGKGDQKGKSDKGKSGKGKGDRGKGKGYGGRKGGRGSKGKGRGFGRGFGKGKGKGKKGGKNVRQVEGKGYESGKGKGGQGVVCYNCGKTGHIASECWSAPSGKGKGKGGKGKVRNVQETGEEDWSTDPQASSSTQPQARTAPAAKGNEQVRRLVTTPMPIIEEVDDDDDDDYVDLIGMFEDLAHDWSVRAVKMTESEQLVKVVNMADESDEEEYERDELHEWYEDLGVDKLNSKKAKPGENILRWDETKQDWMVKPFEIPSPGFTDSEEEIDLSKQDWLEKPVEIPSPGHHIRAVSARYSEPLVEVVLDSGANCHVLPLSYYSEDLGTVEFPALGMVIQDAQGNRIRTTETRANITFEFQRTDGRVIKVRNAAVFGDVTQPLFAVGKLWKVGWALDPLDQFNAFLKKGGARVPVRFVRNSTVTDLKIYRAQVKVVKEEEPQVRKLTLIKQMEEDFEKMKYHEGWFFTSDGKPARFDWDKNTTYDTTKDEVKTFKYRTTLVTRYEGEEIIWNELEFFECAEEWKGSEEVHIDLAKEHSVIITILERKSVGLDEYGDYERPVKKKRKEQEREEDVEMKPSGESSAGSAEKKKTVGEMEEESRQAMEELFPRKPPKEDEGEWKIIENKLPSLGERMEEAMVVAGVELTPDSTLKKLRTACEFLKIGKTGSKAQVWQRLKQAVSANKMKELVEPGRNLKGTRSGILKRAKRREKTRGTSRRREKETRAYAFAKGRLV